MNSKNQAKELAVQSRRHFITTSLMAVTATYITPINMITTNIDQPFKAIAFDGFVIFNPKPVQMLLNELLGSKAAEFGILWRAKQFEYTWLRTVSSTYKNFWDVTSDALNYACIKTGETIADQNKQRLLQKFLELDLWPEVLDGLKELKAKGYKLAFLSNFTPEMMQANVKKNNLEPYFDFQLSTDKVKEFKPSPKAYHMGIEAFKFKKHEILFAAFGAWDASGAKAFGYPTYWVNRLQVPLEELGVIPDGIGHNFNDLTQFLNN